MKDSKTKIIIAVIVLAIVIAGVTFWNINKEKEKEKFKEVSTETKEKIESLYEYYNDLTTYYMSKYKGTDILYSKDKTTLEDISDASLLRVATSYIVKNLDTSITTGTITNLTENEKIKAEDYTFYKGSQVKEVIKKLFGKDFENKSVIGEKDFKYNYIYYKDYDIYAVNTNDLYFEEDEQFQIDYKILKVEENDEKVKINLAVAYVYVDANGTLKYTSNSDASNLVFETKIDNAGITKDEDKFPHFDVYLKKDKDNYTFESIEKVK